MELSSNAARRFLRFLPFFLRFSGKVSRRVARFPLFSKKISTTGVPGNCRFPQNTYEHATNTYEHVMNMQEMRDMTAKLPDYLSCLTAYPHLPTCFARDVACCIVRPHCASGCCFVQHVACCLALRSQLSCNRLLVASYSMVHVALCLLSALASRGGGRHAPIRQSQRLHANVDESLSVGAALTQETPPSCA